MASAPPTSRHGQRPRPCWLSRPASRTSSRPAALRASIRRSHSEWNKANSQFPTPNSQTTSKRQLPIPKMDNPWGLGVGNWESFGNWELAVGNSRRHTSCKCLRLVPTIAANADRWTKHDWVGRGDEWSPGGSHAGTDLLWWRTLLPRIRTLLPARRILEIGPGYGRWTDYLRTSCEHLIAIDVTPACIESCRERFAGDPRLEFHVNDGTSLDAAGTGSVDFVFSFDSLVHAEGDVLDRYVEQFARILAPDGAVFVHHSNLGAFVDPETHDVQRYVTKRHWRAATMTARRMREASRRAGL